MFTKRNTLSPCSPKKDRHSDGNHGKQSKRDDGDLKRQVFVHAAMVAQLSCGDHFGRLRLGVVRS